MSIETLNENLNTVGKTEDPALDALVISLLEADVDVIQKLDDEPNDVGGLTAAELKAKFDEAGNIIKGYLNGTLVPSVSDTVAEAHVRAAAEAERVEQEAGRTAAENARVEAEGGRVGAEAGRVTAEEGRAQAEAARVQAEEERGAAEAAREEAEAAREAAEQARADEHTGLVAQATALAQASAQSAQEAADAVDEGAVRAESYARGGTGTREGEETDNAKYYCDQARQIAGAEYALKTEAQGYVDAHNADQDAHAALFQAAKEEAAATAAKAVVSLVAFTAAEWAAGALTIPQSAHGRQSGAFGFTLRHDVNGTMKGNTWAVLGTDVRYDVDSGAVVLTCADAYAGEIVFLGG